MTVPGTALPIPSRFAAGILIAGLTLIGTAQAQLRRSHPGATSTVAILNDTWNFENNEMRRSIAFAQKADEEGYVPVASLFRASIAAERVHLHNLALAMKKLGYEPEAVPELVAVSSTAENLRLEISSHGIYRENVFPVLLAQARHEGFRGAIQRLSDAGRTEESLVKYYAAALAHLDSAKGKLRETYYVCSACGYITTNADFHVCKVCYHSREKHQAVS
jgi:rubrerythrin